MVRSQCWTRVLNDLEIVCALLKTALMVRIPQLLCNLEIANVPNLCKHVIYYIHCIHTLNQLWRENHFPCSLIQHTHDMVFFTCAPCCRWNKLFQWTREQHTWHLSIVLTLGLLLCPVSLLVLTCIITCLDIAANKHVQYIVVWYGARLWKPLCTLMHRCRLEDVLVLFTRRVLKM